MNLCNTATLLISHSMYVCLYIFIYIYTHVCLGIMNWQCESRIKMNNRVFADGVHRLTFDCCGRSLN